MRGAYNFFFFIVVLGPALILGYQNCAELQSENLPESLEREQNSSFNSSPPLFINNLDLLGYSESQNNCSADSISAMTLYSAFLNLCTIAEDSCEASFLIDLGFKEPSSPSLCSDAQDLESDAALISFKRISTQELGYTPSRATYCSMQITEMIRFKDRTCTYAENGCVKDFLEKKGFIKNTFLTCPN